MKKLILLFFLFPALMFGQMLQPFEKGEKMGYKDKNGKVVLKPIYDYAMEFSEKGIAAVVIDSQWWYINEKGEKLIQPMIIENGPDYFSEGLSRFVKDGKIGFFDETGKVVLQTDYDYVNPFNSGLAAVNIGGYYEQVDEYKLRKGGKWGYINTLGELVIPAEYDFANDFEQGYASVTNGEHSHYIDTEGNLVCDQVVEKVLYGEELVPEQTIDDGLGEYAEETAAVFEECLNKLRLEISERINETEEIPDDILAKGKVCFDEFFQSMKGSTNYSPEMIGIMLGAEFKIRKELNSDVIQLGKALEKAGNKFEVKAPVLVGNPVNNWDITVVAYSQMLINSKDIIYCIPVELAKNLEYVNVAAGPQPPVFLGVKNDAMYFLQQDDYSENNYQKVFDQFFGKQAELSTSSNWMNTVLFFDEYLEIIVNNQFTIEKVKEFSKKYKDKSLFVVFPSQNTARLVPARQVEINYS